MVYFFILFLLYFIGLLEILIDRKDKLINYFLLLFFICFVGLKSAGGTDFGNYEEIYYKLQWSTLTKSLIEPLYAILNVFLKSIWNNFYFFWFVIAVINLSIKISVFQKYTLCLSAALLIYSVGLFIERDFDGVRQGLSIGFCYLSIPYILKDRFIPFLLLVLAATFTHASSIVFLLIYPFRKILISKGFIFIFIFIGIVFVFLNQSIFNLINGFIPIEIVKVKIELYMENEDYSAVQGLNIGLVFRIVILLLFVFLRERIKMNERLYIVLRNGFFFSIMLSLFFYDMQILAHRMPYVFRELQIFIIPSFLTITTDKRVKFLIFSLIFLYSCMLMYRIMLGDNVDAYNAYSNRLFELFY